MKKTLIKIHTLTIKRTGEKQLFQIKLPKNAKCISGVQVTIQPIVLTNSTLPPVIPPLATACDVKIKTDYLFPIPKIL